MPVARQPVCDGAVSGSAIENVLYRVPGKTPSDGWLFFNHIYREQIMKKIILMAIAGFFWKKFQARKGSSVVASGAPRQDRY
jgi:hypothetical protein